MKVCDIRIRVTCDIVTFNSNVTSRHTRDIAPPPLKEGHVTSRVTRLVAGL